MNRRLSFAVLVVSAASACSSGSNIRRFPDAAPVLRVDDRRPFAPAPKSFYSPFIWDGANYTVFRPLSQFWKFETGRQALDVNAIDEVPNSSWFTNRIGAKPTAPEEVHRGACADADDEPKLPWTVVGGKPDGANPGFQVKDGRGTRMLVKVDGVLQPERATAADVLGALLFHSAGYWVPCNRVVFVRKEDMTLEDGAVVKRTNGSVEPLTQETIDKIMQKATEVEPGLYRVSVSEFISGKPIGPWRYEGVRKDDYNDSIPHEERRSNRGMRLLAAWIDHVDTRQENTMLAWIGTSDDGMGFTRHYRIDFGDALGLIAGPEYVPPRLGHVGYFDLGTMAEDFVTLGLIDRPWHDKKLGKAGLPLGYYRDEPFDFDPWQPGYPNPAFDRADESDLAWMARILARFTPQHIDALVDRGRLSNAVVAEELRRILRVRREKMLERYLSKLSPLTWPELRKGRLCLQDLMTWTRLRDRASREYEATLVSEEARRPEILDVQREEDDYVCVPLPTSAAGGGSGYVVVDVSSWTEGRDRPGPARVHLRLDGAPRIVGLERPSSKGEPRL
ncbi:MAG: hypothetical protein HC923_02655 [Myxococcales bacterium]|nr:hypothetical protein [Myxococcales bacterium]